MVSKAYSEADPAEPLWAGVRRIPMKNDAKNPGTADLTTRDALGKAEKPDRSDQIFRLALFVRYVLIWEDGGQ